MHVEKKDAGYGFRGVRVGEAAHPGPSNVRERSPDEDILDSLEAALTRIDSSDEEPLVRPPWGGTCRARLE